MAARYLLACPQCQHAHSVSASQAGETFDCEQCGAKVEAPSLRGIRELPLAEEPVEKRSSKRVWSHSQGVYFSLGLFSLLVGGSLCGIFLSQALQLRTEIPGMEQVKEQFEGVDELPVDDLWRLWSESLKDQPLGEWVESPVESNRRWRNALITLAVPSGIVAIGGLVAMIYSFKSPRQATPRPRRKAS